MDDASVVELTFPLEPLSSKCDTVQTKTLLSDQQFAQVARLLEARPDVCFRVYGGQFDHLEFLRFFPTLKKFYFDCHNLNRIDGLRHLREDLAELIMGDTKGPQSLHHLERFGSLERLYVSGRHKEMGTVSKLVSLRRLALRSTAIDDLSPFESLKHLKVLELRLGKKMNLEPLPRIGKLRYLEIWMMPKLQDISPIREIRTLRYLFLQDLPHVSAMPSMEKMTSLTRIHVEHLRGLRNLVGLAAAPALREALFVSMRQLDREMMMPLVGHPTLESIAIGTGSTRRNGELTAMFGLKEVAFPNWDEILAD